MFIESKKPNDSINVLEFRLYSARTVWWVYQI